MLEDDTLNDRIDQYLSGKFTVGEREAFEREMASDPVLKSEVEDQKLLAGAVIHARREELKSFIKDGLAEEERRKNSRTMWMSLAAATIIAVGAGLYVFLQQESNEASKAAPLASKTEKIVIEPKADSLSATSHQLAKKAPEGAKLHDKRTLKVLDISSPVAAQPSGIMSKPSYLTVTFFDTAANLKGYSCHDHQVRLFGIDPGTKLSAISFKDGIYLNFGGYYYQITSDGKFHNLPTPIKKLDI